MNFPHHSRALCIAHGWAKFSAILVLSPIQDGDGTRTWSPVAPGSPQKLAHKSAWFNKLVEKVIYKYFYLWRSLDSEHIRWLQFQKDWWLLVCTHMVSSNYIFSSLWGSWFFSLWSPASFHVLYKVLRAHPPPLFPVVSHSLQYMVAKLFSCAFHSTRLAVWFSQSWWRWPSTRQGPHIRG